MPYSIKTPFVVNTNQTTTLGAVVGTTLNTTGLITAEGGVIIPSNGNNNGNSLYVVNSSSDNSAYSDIALGNNTVNALHIFLNSSNRTGDGGVNTATIRNDAGILRLQSNTGGGINITSGLATFDSGLTSTTGTTTLGATTIGAISGTSATFSSTLGVTGLATFGAGGLTSTAGTTTLGATTIGAITGTSASFSTTLGVTGLATFGAGGLTSTAGTTTLGATTIGAITGTSATFSTTLGVTGLITANGGVTIPSNGINNGNSLYIANSSSDSSAYTDIAVGNNTANALHIFLNSSNRTSEGGVNTATIRNDAGTLRLQSIGGGGISITSGLATFDSGLTSTAGTTTLGVTTIGAITGTSATFSSTLGVTGLATFGSGGLTSTAGTTTLGVTTIGAITGSSATFSSIVTVSGGLTSTVGTTNLGVTNIGALSGTSATFSTTLGVTGLATFGAGGLTSTAGTTTLAATTIGAITGTSATFSSTLNTNGLITANGGVSILNNVNGPGNTFYLYNSNAGINAYSNFIIGNDTGNLNMILNSSTRTDDGGVNTATLRNDTGTLRLQSSSGSGITITSGLATFGNGLTSTAGATTLGTSTIGTITGTSATFSTTTASTSNTTGSITTAGGISSSNTTDATSSTNGGSVTTAGGLAVAKKAFIGTDLTVSGNSILRSIQTANFSSISTQGGYLQWNRSATDGELWLINTTVGSNPGIRFGKSNLSNVVTELMRISDNGVVNITSTTASTSNTTGGLTLASGLGISNTTDATSSTNGGTVTTAGGLAVAKKAFIGTDLNVGGNITRNAQLVVMTINNLQAIPTTINWNTTSSGTLANMSLAHSSGTFTYSGSNPSTFYLNIGIYLTGATAGTFVCEINFNGSILSRHHQYSVNGGSILASTVINMSNTNTFSVYINGPTANANNSGDSYTWLRISQI